MPGAARQPCQVAASAQCAVGLDAQADLHRSNAYLLVCKRFHRPRFIWHLDWRGAHAGADMLFARFGGDRHPLRDRPLPADTVGDGCAPRGHREGKQGAFCEVSRPLPRRSSARLSSTLRRAAQAPKGAEAQREQGNPIPCRWLTAIMRKPSPGGLARHLAAAALSFGSATKPGFVRSSQSRSRTSRLLTRMTFHVTTRLLPRLLFR
jgi:hypothetical protein